MNSWESRRSASTSRPIASPVVQYAYDKMSNLVSVTDPLNVHQKDDMSVLFYENMDFGRMKNADLNVNHKTWVHSAKRAGTIFFVSPIKDHPRAPRSPLGEK